MAIVLLQLLLYCMAKHTTQDGPNNHQWIPLHYKSHSLDLENVILDIGDL